MEYIEFKEIVNDRILKIIDSRKLSIKNIIETSGISRSQVYKILSGKSDTTLVTLYKLLSSLNVDMESFFNFSILPEQIQKNKNNPESKDVLCIVRKSLKVKQANLSRLKGLTQGTIAEKMGYTDYKYINKLLNGKNNLIKDMYLATLFSIVKQLGLEHEIHVSPGRRF